MHHHFMMLYSWLFHENIYNSLRITCISRRDKLCLVHNMCIIGYIFYWDEPCVLLQSHKVFKLNAQYWLKSPSDYDTTVGLLDIFYTFFKRAIFLLLFLSMYLLFLHVFEEISCLPFLFAYQNVNRSSTFLLFSFLGK